ncbi:hypothetical protein D9M71_656110 [compost metagenome]
MMPGYAAHAVGRRVPPLLAEQEGLVHQVERPVVPFVGGKALVPARRLDAFVRRAVRSGQGDLAQILGQPVGLLQRQVEQLQLLAGRAGEMAGPVDQGEQQGGRRHGGAGAGDGGMHLEIEGVERRQAGWCRISHRLWGDHVHLLLLA